MPANAGSRGSFTILKMQDFPHFLVPFMQHPVTNKPTMFSLCDQVANMSTFALETSAGLLWPGKKHGPLVAVSWVTRWMLGMILRQFRSSKKYSKDWWFPLVSCIICLWKKGKTSIQPGGFRERCTQIQGAKMGRIKGKDPKISSHEIQSEGFWEWPKLWNFAIQSQYYIKHTKTSKTSFVSASSHFSCQSISDFVNPILFCRMVNMQSLFRNQISGYLWHPLVRFPQ